MLCENFIYDQRFAKRTNFGYTVCEFESIQFKKQITHFSYSIHRHLSLSHAYQEIFEQKCRYNIMYSINFANIITIIYVCFLFFVCDSSLLCIIMDALTHMSTLLCCRATTVATAADAVDASDTTTMLMHSPQSKQQQQQRY